MSDTLTPHALSPEPAKKPGLTEQSAAEPQKASGPSEDASNPGRQAVEPPADAHPEHQRIWAERQEKGAEKAAAPINHDKSRLGGIKSDYSGANIARGSEAIERVLRDRVSVPAAMSHSELGEIDFHWGEPGDPAKDYHGGWGLAHIVAKHGEPVARMMPKIIAEGKVVDRYGPPGGERVNVSDGDHTAVLSLRRFGKRETWLLTGWKEKGPDATGGGNGPTGPTPNGPMRTRPEGVAGPTTIIGAPGPEVKSGTHPAPKRPLARKAEAGEKAAAPLLVDAAQAAALCNVSRATWFNWQASGQIPLPCLSKGRVRRWARQEIESWILAGTPPLSRWTVLRGARK